MHPCHTSIRKNHSPRHLLAIVPHHHWSNYERHSFDLLIVNKFGDDKDHWIVDTKPFTLMSQIHFVNAYLKIVLVGLERVPQFHSVHMIIGDGYPVCFLLC